MTDEKIIELYFARSENAIKKTDEQYGKYFRYIAKSIVNNEEDAEEIVSDVYLKAWNQIPPETPRFLKAYLGKIARTLAINRLEMRTAEKRGGREYDIVLDELHELREGENGDDIHDRMALRDAIQRFLTAQPIHARRIFIRRYWYMSSIAEIAEEYGFSESKVKMMLMRMREKLKSYLAEEGIAL